jgi:hypothetical protein
MNTADMATKILPAKTVSVFSKVVLGLTNTLQFLMDVSPDNTDTDYSAIAT